MPRPPLLDRMRELRHNASANHAAYVALAERLQAVLHLRCQARYREWTNPASFDQIVQPQKDPSVKSGGQLMYQRSPRPKTVGRSSGRQQLKNGGRPEWVAGLTACR
jgi:hypothetical protein